MDVPYRNPDTGEERNLPDGLGESMGWEKVQGFVPAELQESTATDSDAGETDDSQSTAPTPEKPSLKAAVGTIKEFIETATDEEITDERVEILSDLFDGLLNFEPLGVSVDATEEQTASPILEVVMTLEAAIEKDGKISNTAKEAIKKHLNELLSTSAEPKTGEGVNNGSPS